MIKIGLLPLICMLVEVEICLQNAKYVLKIGLFSNSNRFEKIMIKELINRSISRIYFVFFKTISTKMQAKYLKKKLKQGKLSVSFNIIVLKMK